MLKQIDYQGSLEEVANKFQGRKAEVSEEVNKSVQEIVNAIRKEGAGNIVVQQHLSLVSETLLEADQDDFKVEIFL